MSFKKFIRHSPHIIALFASVNLSWAQMPAEEAFAIHPKGGFLLGNNVSDFTVFQGLENYCEPYSSHFTSNFSGGIFGEVPVFLKTHIGLGIGYSRNNARFTSQKSYPKRDTTEGQNVIRDVLYENEVLANLSFLDIQPEIRYTLLDNFINGPFRSMAALRISLPVRGDFTQTDRIVSPETATFSHDADGIRVREKQITNGDFTTKNPVGFGISAGLENLLKVGNSTHFTQQIVFDYNFTSVLSDATWNPWAIRAELGLRFGVLKTPPKEKPVEIIPPPADTTPVVVEKQPPAPPFLQIAITDVRAKLQTGNELQATAPLVNAVFFDRASAEIPSRYNRSASVNESQQNTLPLIAQIVFKNPKARIVLEGATSGASDEPEGIELARKRVQSVQDVLKNLGVPESSITTRTSVLPRNPSNQDVPSGREENRRVDIIVQNAPLQEYVARQQFAQVTGDLTAELSTHNIPETSPLELRSPCSPSSSEISSASGVKNLSFVCEASPNQNEIPLEVTVFSSFAGRSVNDTRTLALPELPKEQIELKTDDFDAVLRFDYNSAALSAENKELLKQMSQFLPSGATIQIYGSSDVTTGSEQRNAELSSARAKATEDFLKSISTGKFTFETRTDAQKFSEETPEGRFLNRSIRVRVKQ